MATNARFANAQIPSGSSGHLTMERERLSVPFDLMNGKSLTLIYINDAFGRAANSICVGNVTALS
jgi:hypothetical protein